MGQPATLVVDIETVGQDPEIIPPRAREILLDVESDEDRLKVLDSLGLDATNSGPFCILEEEQFVPDRGTADREAKLIAREYRFRDSIGVVIERVRCQS